MIYMDLRKVETSGKGIEMGHPNIQKTKQTIEGMRSTTECWPKRKDCKKKKLKKAELQGPQILESHVESENPQRKLRGSDRKGRAGNSREWQHQSCQLMEWKKMVVEEQQKNTPACILHGVKALRNVPVYTSLGHHGESLPLTYEMSFRSTGDMAPLNRFFNCYLKDKQLCSTLISLPRTSIKE